MSILALTLIGDGTNLENSPVIAFKAPACVDADAWCGSGAACMQSRFLLRIESSHVGTEPLDEMYIGSTEEEHRNCCF